MRNVNINGAGCVKGNTHMIITKRENVKEINFVIRDVKFLPHQSEIAHEFEINPTDVLFNAYDITEKNKLQHF